MIRVRKWLGDLALNGKRLFFLVLACVFLMIAMLGVVTPGLPTTEFVLLGAWCAAKGSQRFHEWLMNRSFFGAMIRHWQEDKSIHRNSKITATCMMLLSITLMVIWVPHPLMVGILSIMMLISIAWIWSRPEPQRNRLSAFQCPSDKLSDEIEY